MRRVNLTSAFAETEMADGLSIAKEALQPDRVLIWNSTTRSTSLPYLAAPSAEVSSAGAQRPAEFAHVDQDEHWGREMVRRAVGRDPGEYRRSMILNLWRPLFGRYPRPALGLCSCVLTDRGRTSHRVPAGGARLPLPSLSSIGTLSAQSRTVRHRLALDLPPKHALVLPPTSDEGRGRPAQVLGQFRPRLGRGGSGIWSTRCG